MTVRYPLTMLNNLPIRLGKHAGTKRSASYHRLKVLGDNPPRKRLEHARVGGYDFLTYAEHDACTRKALEAGPLAIARRVTYHDCAQMLMMNRQNSFHATPKA